MAARSRPERKPSKLSLFIENKTGSLHNVYKKDVADALGISGANLSHKMKDGRFSYKETVKILKFLNATTQEVLDVMKEV